MEENLGEPQLLKDFKALVARDYVMAEAIYVSVVFAGLILFAQQAVRVYKHCIFSPDNVCPWRFMPIEDPLNF